MEDAPPRGVRRRRPLQKSMPPLGRGREGHAGAMSDLRQTSLRQLLGRHADIMEELRHRGVGYSGGNLTAGLARFLFCAAYGWGDVFGWEEGCSAVGAEGIRYLIRGRRLHRRNGSRQLSAIRDVHGFDTLAAVLLGADHRVLRAALIPHAVVLERGSFVQGTNRCRLTLSRDVWRDARVSDATGRLRAVEAKA